MTSLETPSQPLSMLRSHQPAINGIQKAPAIHAPFHVADSEAQLVTVLTPCYLQDNMRKESVSRLNLAEHDVLEFHFVSILHRLIGATVVAINNGPKRPSRAAVAHIPAAIEHAAIEHRATRWSRWPRFSIFASEDLVVSSADAASVLLGLLFFLFFKCSNKHKARQVGLQGLVALRHNLCCCTFHCNGKLQ